MRFCPLGTAELRQLWTSKDAVTVVPFLLTRAQGHSEQPCSRIFDVLIFVLSRSGLHREQTAPVNVCEVTVRKLVSALRIHTVPLVDSEIPFPNFRRIRADG